MDFALQITRMLHEDHMNKLALMGRLEKLAGQPQPGNTEDQQTRNLLDDIVAELGRAPDPHFELEERELFPRLAQQGMSEIGELLNDEHRTIEAIAGSLVQIAEDGRRQNFDTESWASFRRLAGELVTVLTGHIDKEEMGLLPMIEEILDADEDSSLAMGYAERR